MKIRSLVLAVLLVLPAFAGGAFAQVAAPAPAGPPPLPKGVAPFEVAQYNSFTWYGRFGYSNCAFIDMGEGVLVIDTGWTKQDAENLKAQIKEKTKGKPVKWIVMTQTDVDVNGGIEAFLPTDATVFVHTRAVDPLSRGILRSAPGKKGPTVVGVQERLLLTAGGRRFELLASAGNAHSAYDLVAYCHDNGLAFVGDLVSPARCPNFTNPVADPKGWDTMIDRIRELHPAGVLGSRGEPSSVALQELELVQVYIERLLQFLSEQKAKNAPEARVAAELTLRKIGNYCPIEIDNANVRALYKRMQRDGTFSVPKPPAPKPAAGLPVSGAAPKR